MTTSGSDAARPDAGGDQVALELFASNLATTTVSSGGTTAPASGTSEAWTVASSAMFGAAATGISQFHVADAAAGRGTEVIAVTNVSGTTWTVTRGAESTTPVSHAGGFTVYQVTTAGLFASAAAQAACQLPAPSGDATGATDPAALQAVLTAARTAGGGTVRAYPGATYYTNAPLRIGSNTTLDMTGATISLVQNSSCNILQNWAVQANTRCVDGVSNSTTTFTSATANFQPSNVGNAIRIYYGDGTWLDTTIAARGSATSITLAATTTESGTALYFYFGAGRDSGIRVLGGTWIRQLSNFAPTSQDGWDANSIRIRHCDGLETGGITATNYAGKYFVNPGDCTNFWIHDITAPAYLYSDLVHVNGPASYGVIQRIINDNPGDDVVALTGADYRNQQAWQADVMGNITDISIWQVQASPGFVTWPRAVLILAGQSGASNAYTVDRIDVRDIRCQLHNYPVFIGPDTADSFTQGGAWGRILVDGVVNHAASPPGGAVAVLSPATVTSLEIRSVIDIGASTSAYVQSGATVTRLVIYGVDQGLISVLGTATNLFIINNPANLGVANTFTAQQTFTGQVSTGAVITEDITVRPNAARSSSASVFLDNTAGQIWEFFCNSGGGFGVYDDSGGQQPITIGSGGITTQLNLYSGNIYVVNANLNVNTAGYGVQIKEGSNAKQGTLTLNGTTAVVVSNTSVTANSRIFLTIQSPGGTVGSPYVSARTAGTSFSVKSTAAGDTSTCAYFITEPG
jgi:hypothetical protein